MTNEEYLKSAIHELSKPLAYKWKLQSYTKAKDKAMCVAFIDARDVTKRLNEICVYGWHRDHFILGIDVYCKVGLTMPDGSIIWRADAGESENDTERGKTAASDSFKRAAKEFGIGLFLYDLDIVRLPVKKDGDYHNIVDEQGNKVWDLTKYINEEYGKKKTTTPQNTPKQQTKPLTPESKDWSAVIAKLKGSPATKDKPEVLPITIETVKKFYSLSPENEAKLIEQSSKPKA